MAIKINGVTVIADNQNITSTGTISATGNITSAGNIVTTGTIVGNVQTTGPVSTTGNITAGNISATGNITGSFFVGNGSQLTGIDATQIQSGTSNVKVVSSGGNVTASVGGTSNVLVIASSGTVTTGTASVSGNITGGNLTTTGTATIGGFTISGNTIVSSGSTLTIDPNASGGVDGLVVISGNLQVTGNTTIINSNVVSTNDLTLNLANNAINSSAANGAGIEAGPIGSPFLTFLYNNTSNVWTSSGGLSAVGTVTAASTVGGVITGTSASVSGTVTAASTVGGVITGSSVSVTGNVNGGNLNVTGNIVDTGAMTIITGSNGNIVLAPNGTGVVVLNTDLRNGQANGVGNIGATSARFNQVFALASSAQYADLAEKYTADATYPSGTVVSFGGTQEITISLADSDSRVAGVISTNPSFRMNDTLVSEHTAMVALTGRVPTSVTGTVRKGDLMVSAGNGVARSEANPTIGTVIGKALADSDGDAVIEVVVGRF